MTRPRLRLYEVVCAAVLVAAASAPGAAQHPARREGVEEVPLTLIYRPYVRAAITSLHRDGTFYLPLGETLSKLEIDHRLDTRQGTASGQYLHLRKRMQYRADFRNGTARVGDRTHHLARESYLVTELEIFVVPAVLEQLFGLRSNVDASMLAVEVNAQDQLPVTESFRRRERQAAFAPVSDTTVAPLRYARDWNAVDGGVLEYFLSGESAGRSSASRFQLRAGGELLGGDIQAAIHGTHRAGQSRVLDDSDWRWHYVFGESRAISQLTLGRFFSSGLQANDVHGVEVTNQPIEPRARLGTYAVDGVTEPNSEVELYINERFTEVTHADALGHYRFDVPLTYGASVIRLQFYGPGGGVQREERALQVPFTFVPRGRADYRAVVGRLRRGGEDFAQGSLAFGLSDRFTGRVAIDYGGSYAPGPAIPYGGISARLGTGYVMAMEAAPGTLYRATGEAHFPSRANLSATATRYTGDRLRSSAGIAEEWSVRGIAPIGPARGATVLQLRAAQRAFRNGGRSSDAGVEGATQFGYVRPMIGYDWERFRFGTGSVRPARNTVRTGARFRLPGHGRSRRWLANTLFSWLHAYDVQARTARHVQLHLSAPLARSHRLEASFNRDYPTRVTQLDVHFLLELPYLRSATAVSRHARRQSVVQSVRGAVGYDSRSRALVLSDRQWAGHSGLAMQFFLDRNGNEKFDVGEEPVSGATVRLDRPVNLEHAGSGLLRATDLPAYLRYGASVDLSGVRNPLWVPKYQAFRFVTDPNRYKRIDVPFFVGGVVEGTVLRRVGTDARAVPGLKVHLRGVDVNFRIDLTTFGDGTFYHMGVPPGRYTIEVDPAQLSLLGTTAEPSVRGFQVRVTPTGDFVEGLDFLLVPR